MKKTVQLTAELWNGRIRGYAFYVKDGHLILRNEDSGAYAKLTAQDALNLRDYLNDHVETAPRLV